MFMDATVAVEPSVDVRRPERIERIEGTDQSRIALLDALKRQIAAASLDDRQAFQRAIMGACDVLGYTEVKIAETFSCSRMTANRWIRGEAAPFTGMRIIIFKHL